MNNAPQKPVEDTEKTTMDAWTQKVKDGTAPTFKTRGVPVADPSSQPKP